MEGNRPALSPAGAGPSVLVVEDEAVVAQAIASFLGRRLGATVEIAQDGKDALSLFGRSSHSLVVLDWQLAEPQMDGLRVCVELRKVSRTVAIIFVTARNTLEDRLSALQAGADDFLVKPFEPEELAARALAVLRRSSPPPTAVSGPPPPSMLVYDALTIDLAQQVLLVGGTVVELTRVQFQLLMYLMQQAERVVDHETLRKEVLRTHTAEDSSSVRNHVHKLKLRLGAAGRLICAVRGRGYRLSGDTSVPIVAKK